MNFNMDDLRNQPMNFAKSGPPLADAAAIAPPPLRIGPVVVDPPVLEGPMAGVANYA